MSPSASTSGSGEAEIGLDGDPAGPVEVEAGLACELRRQVGGGDARRPDRRARGDLLDLAVPGPDRDRVGGDVDDGVPGERCDAQLLERACRLPRERLGEARQDAVGGFDEQHARRPWVDRTEVATQRVVCELGDLAGHLDAGRPGADDDEVSQLGAARGRSRLRRLERARMRLRISSAPASDFSSGACSLHSSWPK